MELVSYMKVDRLCMHISLHIFTRAHNFTTHDLVCREVLNYATGCRLM
jgi:hypothetical protein